MKGVPRTGESSSRKREPSAGTADGSTVTSPPRYRRGSTDAEEQQEESERRRLALVRSQLDQLDEDYPDGWEISELVVTARFSRAPEPVRPWTPGRVARIQAGT